jgi:hypothetical protein
MDEVQFGPARTGGPTAHHRIMPTQHTGGMGSCDSLCKCKNINGSHFFNFRPHYPVHFESWCFKTGQYRND